MAVSASHRPIRAVTFDYWNTICVPDDHRFRSHRLSGLRDALGELGLVVTDDDVVAASDGLIELFNRHWAANQQFTVVEAVDYILGRLGAELPEHHVDAVTMAFAHAIEEPPPLAPNIGTALAALRERDVAVGIICDVGMTPSTVLRRYLDAHGLLDRFDHCSFSDEVGVYKPDRRIFEHALAGLGGLSPGEAAHVGDLRRTDVAGAQGIGMVTVRYRAVHDDSPDGDAVAESEPPREGVIDRTGAAPAPEADHVIDDHTELLEALTR